MKKKNSKILKKKNFDFSAFSLKKSSH